MPRRVALSGQWIGLGNTPFPRTRHSVGALFVDYVARTEQLQWTRQRAYDYALRFVAPRPPTTTTTTP